MVGFNPLIPPPPHCCEHGGILNAARPFTLTFQMQLFFCSLFSILIKDTDVQDAEGSQDGATAFDRCTA